MPVGIPNCLKGVLDVKPPKLLISVTLLVVWASVGFLVWHVRSSSDGSAFAEGRHSFHRQQLDFKAHCEKGVVGRPLDEVLPAFGGFQSKDFAGKTYSWKEWPCHLVVNEGVVEGVFYHDFPFRMQPVPADYRVTHALPYFERHPEFLREEYSGRWDNKGGYVFEKTATSR